MNKIFKKNKGFTVLESLVAIAVLSLSISGAFVAIQQTLSQSIISKEEVQAFYLAQEAVEIIRNKRDSNQLARISTGSGDWLAGIAQNVGDPCYFGKTCQADASAMSLTYCGAAWGTCPNIKQDGSNYLFNYTSGNTTNFKREIQLEQINANEIAVTVRVSWTKGIFPFEFKAKTILFNWI